MMNIEKYHITENSFGSECPRNWEEIANYLNEKIDTALDGMDDELIDDWQEVKNKCDEIWENYSNGVYQDVPEADWKEPICSILANMTDERIVISWNHDDHRMYASDSDEPIDTPMVNTRDEAENICWNMWGVDPVGVWGLEWIEE